MTAKKASEEIYNNRYAFMRYAQGTKQSMLDDKNYAESTMQFAGANDISTSRTFFKGSIQQSDLVTPEQTQRNQSSRQVQAWGQTAGPQSNKSSFKGRNIRTEMSRGNSIVPQSRCGFIDEDPGALRFNQSQHKFWYKVRVKSSKGTRPKVMETFRNQLEIESLRRMSSNLNQQSNFNVKEIPESEKNRIANMMTEQEAKVEVVQDDKHNINYEPDSAFSREYILQVGTDEQSVMQRKHEQSYSNVMTRLAPNPQNIDFYNVNELMQSNKNMMRSTVMAAQVPQCSLVTPGFQKSLNMKLTTLKEISGPQKPSTSMQSRRSNRNMQFTSKSVHRDKLPEQNPQFLNSTKKKASNLLDMMKVNSRQTK